jgi:hypothetical protein
VNGPDHAAAVFTDPPRGPMLTDTVPQVTVASLEIAVRRRGSGAGGA